MCPQDSLFTVCVWRRRAVARVLEAAAHLAGFAVMCDASRHFMQCKRMNTIKKHVPARVIDYDHGDEAYV